MRQTHDSQPSLTYPWLDLDHARELKALSDLLDEHPTILDLVLQDLSPGSPTGAAKGARGLTAEQVFRALILKQMMGFSYRELLQRPRSSCRVTEEGFFVGARHRGSVRVLYFFDGSQRPGEECDEEIEQGSELVSKRCLVPTTSVSGDLKTPKMYGISTEAGMPYGILSRPRLES